jgi:hypothetical protein
MAVTRQVRPSRRRDSVTIPRLENAQPGGSLMPLWALSPRNPPETTRVPFGQVASMVVGTVVLRSLST